MFVGYPITSSDVLLLSYRRRGGARQLNYGFECQCVAHVQWNNVMAYFKPGK